MNPHATPQPETGKPGPPRWQVTVYQVLFGAMAVTFGGLISAEPTLLLERQDDGRIEAWYALEAYGRVPTLRYAVRDLVRYEVTRSEESGSRGTSSSGAVTPRTSYNLVLRDRDGSSFAIGQAFDLLPIDRMLDGRHPESAHQERIAAGTARRRGGWGLGAFGALLLSGAVWNLWLMATGLRSPRERAAAALAAMVLLAPGGAAPALAAEAGPDGGRPGVPIAVSPGDSADFAESPTACPPFSWTLLAEARGYDLVVVALPEEPEETSSGSPRPFEVPDDRDAVVLRQRVPGGASHWLPSASRCLSPGGRYAWSVRARHDSGWSEWSDPLLFTAPGRLVVRAPMPPSGAERIDEPPVPEPKRTTACVGTCPSISTSGIIESTSKGFRFPDGSIQTKAFTLIVLHAVVQGDGVLQHGNVVSSTRTATGTYSVDLGRLGLGCSATASTGVYNPAAVQVIPEGSAVPFVRSSSTHVTVFTSDPSGSATNWPFMLHVVCNPFIVIN